jgi:hypothetical protein
MTNNLYHTISALVACGMVSGKELKDATAAELFDLATKKTLQIAMAGRRVQVAYRIAYHSVAGTISPRNGLTVFED